MQCPGLSWPPALITKLTIIRTQANGGSQIRWLTHRPGGHIVLTNIREFIYTFVDHSIIVLCSHLQVCLVPQWIIKILS